jgi:hypothetical protein
MVYHVFIYIYSLLIEKDICDRQNMFPCMCLSSGDLFIFLKSFPLFVLSALRYFPFHVVTDRRKLENRRNKKQIGEKLRLNGLVSEMEDSKLADIGTSRDRTWGNCPD